MNLFLPGDDLGELKSEILRPDEVEKIAILQAAPKLKILYPKKITKR